VPAVIAVAAIAVTAANIAAVAAAAATMADARSFAILRCESQKGWRLEGPYNLVRHVKGSIPLARVETDGKACISPVGKPHVFELLNIIENSGYNLHQTTASNSTAGGTTEMYVFVGASGSGIALDDAEGVGAHESVDAGTHEEHYENYAAPNNGEPDYDGYGEEAALGTEEPEDEAEGAYANAEDENSLYASEGYLPTSGKAPSRPPIGKAPSSRPGAKMMSTKLASKPALKPAPPSTPPPKVRASISSGLQNRVIAKASSFGKGQAVPRGPPARNKPY